MMENAIIKQNTQTLRPQCGTGAQTFLNAVYNRGTQAKKRQTDVPQYGRSMIEMLAVLAIIGVLTVGSITAYSKAMQRHLLNKQSEQISYILSAIETNFDALSLSSGTTSFNIFKTFGWIPEEMIKDNSGYAYDVFNNRVFLYDPGSYKYLNIRITDRKSYEQCVNLYQLATKYSSFLWTIQIHKSLGSTTRTYVLGYGDKYCDHSNCIKNKTLPQISQFCHNCDERDQCNLYFFWK